MGIKENVPPRVLQPRVHTEVAVDQAGELLLMMHAVHNGRWEYLRGSWDVYWQRYLQASNISEAPKIQCGAGDNIIGVGYCVPMEVLQLAEGHKNSMQACIDMLVSVLRITLQVGAFTLPFTDQVNIMDLCEGIYRVYEEQDRQYNNNKPLVVLSNQETYNMIRKMVVKAMPAVVSDPLDSSTANQIVIDGLTFQPFPKP